MAGTKEEGHEMCKNLNPSSCSQLESRVRPKVHARFGRGRSNKGHQWYLVGPLPLVQSLAGRMEDEQQRTTFLTALTSL